MSAIKKLIPIRFFNGLHLRNIDSDFLGCQSYHVSEIISKVTEFINIDQKYRSNNCSYISEHYLTHQSGNILLKISDINKFPIGFCYVCTQFDSENKETPVSTPVYVVDELDVLNLNRINEVQCKISIANAIDSIKKRCQFIAINS